MVEGDVLYLQRPTQNHWFVAMLAAFKRRRPSVPVVFDFCDPIWLHSPFKTRTLARLADLVVTSCEDLAEWAQDHGDRVVVVPNSLPSLPLPRPEPQSISSLPTLGWVGNATVHRQNLTLLAEALDELRRPARFCLVGSRGAEDLVDRFATIPNLEVQNHPWLGPDEVATILERVDIALLPVRDVPWNRKLLTKLIEYLGAGLPVIASPVGDNRRAIHHGVNGMLAATASEWRDCLGRLIDEPELRASLGRAARETAAGRYGLEVNGPKLARALRELVSVSNLQVG